MAEVERGRATAAARRAVRGTEASTRPSDRVADMAENGAEGAAKVSSCPMRIGVKLEFALQGVSIPPLLLLPLRLSLLFPPLSSLHTAQIDGVQGGEGVVCLKLDGRVYHPHQPRLLDRHRSSSFPHIDPERDSRTLPCTSTDYIRTLDRHTRPTAVPTTAKLAQNSHSRVSHPRIPPSSCPHLLLRSPPATQRPHLHSHCHLGCSPHPIIARNDTTTLPRTRQEEKACSDAVAGRHEAVCETVRHFVSRYHDGYDRVGNTRRRFSFLPEGVCEGGDLGDVTGALALVIHSLTPY